MNARATTGAHWASPWPNAIPVRGCARLDNDLALGQGRIPLVDQPYGPYAKVDAAGYQMLFDYRGGYRRFRQISFAEIIDRPELAATLRDRIVLIGTAALSIKDHFATPFSTGWGGEGSLIGIALHAHIADQLIRLANGESRNPVPLPRLLDNVAIWAAAMAGAVLALLVWRVTVVLVALLLGLGLVGGTTAWGFASAGLLLPGVPVALAWVLSAAGCNFVMHSVGLRERTQLRRSFESYLDPRIINQMMQGDTLPSFGGEHREITAIFTDIAGFTTTAETMDAATVAGLLGDYFGVLTDVVVENGGLVNDFIGDGLLVLFGAPMHQPDHADRAVAAALAMAETAQRFTAGLGGARHRVGPYPHRRAYRHGAGRQYRHPREAQIRRSGRYAEHRLARGGVEQVHRQPCGCDRRDRGAVPAPRVSSAWGHNRQGPKERAGHPGAGLAGRLAGAAGPLCRSLCRAKQGKA